VRYAFFVKNEECERLVAFHATFWSFEIGICFVPTRTGPLCRVLDKSFFILLGIRWVFEKNG